MSLSQQSGVSLVRERRLITGAVKVCTYGDSILAQGNTGVDAVPDTKPGGVTSRSQGVFNQLSALMGYPFLHQNKWIGSNASGFEIVGYDAGISGHKIQDCIDDVDRVLRLQADACLLLIGTNDISGSSTTIADMKTRYEALIDIIIDSGTNVWGLTVMPRNAVDGSADWTTAERLVHLEFNDWLRSLDRVKSGFTLFDWYSVLVDHTTGDMITGFTSDSVHFATKGAVAGAKFIRDKLVSIYPTFRSFPYMSNVLDVFDATNRRHGNLFTDAVFTGTGGTKDTGITGVVPDGINIDNEDTTNVTAVMSVNAAPTDQDQYGGNWLRFVVTSNGSGGSEAFVRMQKTSPVNLAVPSGIVNQWLQAGCFVKITAPTVDDFLIGVYVLLKRVTVNLNTIAIQDAGLPMVNENAFQVLETQPLFFDDDTDTARIEIFIEVNADIAASVTIEIGQPYVKLMPINPDFGG